MTPQTHIMTSADHRPESEGSRVVGGQTGPGAQLVALIDVLEGGNPRFDRLIECRQELSQLGAAVFPGYVRITKILDELHAAFEFCESREFDLVSELQGLMSSLPPKPADGGLRDI
jgi:hypothetical protein